MLSTSIQDGGGIAIYPEIDFRRGLFRVTTAHLDKPVFAIHLAMRNAHSELIATGKKARRSDEPCGVRNAAGSSCPEVD